MKQFELVSIAKPPIHNVLQPTIPNQIIDHFSLKFCQSAIATNTTVSTFGIPPFPITIRIEPSPTTHEALHSFNHVTSLCNLH